MRLTAHHGRAGKNGAYSSKHNDRNFDVGEAAHIDPDRIGGDRFWSRYRGMSFDDTEAYYYERHFRAILDERNERRIQQRHPERVQTMEDYRKSRKTCPEETIYQIGKQGDTVDPDLLWAIVAEHIDWQQRHYPNVQLLDVALHIDEEGAPHVHERKVWVAHDEDGREIVGQARALAEMGIEPPDPSKKISKRNNAKMTYTAECRAHLFAVARAHGLELEEQPRERSQSGLSQIEYKAQQEEAKAAAAERAAKDAERRQEAAERAEERAKDAVREEVNLLNDIKLEQAEAMSREVFERSIVTAGEAMRIPARPNKLNREEVIINKADFERLQATAAAHYNVADELAEARRILADRDKIVEAAERRVRELESVAETLDGQLATSQLRRVRRDHPELFSAAGDYIGSKDRDRSPHDRVNEVGHDER